jgi:hypothetical protein
MSGCADAVLHPQLPRVVSTLTSFISDSSLPVLESISIAPKALTILKTDARANGVFLNRFLVIINPMLFEQ